MWLVFVERSAPLNRQMLLSLIKYYQNDSVMCLGRRCNPVLPQSSHQYSLSPCPCDCAL